MPNDHSDLLTRYEGILALSEEILLRMQKHETDRIELLQSEREAALASITASQLAGLSLQGTEALREIIRKIEETDAKTMFYATHWRSDMAVMFPNSRKTSSGDELPFSSVGST